MNLHTMVLEKIQPSGEQEWYCPTCGRRFLLQLPPNYKKTILVAGDRTVKHTGGNYQAMDMNVEFSSVQGQQEAPVADQHVFVMEDRTPASAPPPENLQKMLKDTGLDHLL
jgi:hypothetical protein